MKALKIIGIAVFLFVTSCTPQSRYVLTGGKTPTSTAGAQLTSSVPGYATPPGISTASPQPVPNTGGSPSPQYLYPPENARFVSSETTLIIRYGPKISPGTLAAFNVSLQGAKTGAHAGKIVLADDQKTLIFKPDQPFAPGEQVQVKIGSLNPGAGSAFGPMAYTFTVAEKEKPGTVASTTIPTAQPEAAFPELLTVPQDIPHFTVSKTSPDQGEGDIFIAPFYWNASTLGSYLLILDNQGQLVYYQSMADNFAAFDFKALPGGYLTYFNQKDSTHYLLDSHYQVVGSYQAGLGYTSDLHDFLRMTDGYTLLLAYDTITMDMSKVVPGGNPNADVTGLILQEMDPSGNVILNWRSWDYFSFADTTVSLTDAQIDWVHGNGLALANDGNILLSSRNLSEITKINRQTGAVMWRLGGKANQFKFVNDGGFSYQHDISELSNGDIMVFDNHGTDQSPTPSRAVEYKLDEVKMTATRVWEYTHQPPIFTDYMGLAERMTDGNTFIAWGDDVVTNGYAAGSVTEVNPQNQIVFEMTFDRPFVSYRAMRAPWHGSPLTPPALAYRQEGNNLLLGYSWNGATDVASWTVYGGSSPSALKQVDEKQKSGFETQSTLTNPPSQECYFQAAAIDQNGKEMARSPVISTDPVACPLS